MAVVPGGFSLALPTVNRVLEYIQNAGDYLAANGDDAGLFLGRTAAEAAAGWGAGMATGVPVAPPMLMFALLPATLLITGIGVVLMLMCPIRMPLTVLSLC